MFYAKLNQLCVQKGVSVTKLCEEIGLTSAAPTKWKRGAKPYYSTLFKIAQYFDVDVEFLADDNYDDYDLWLQEVKSMTRAEYVQSVNWAKEKASTDKADALDDEFVALARQLTPGQAQRVKDFMRGMLS